jgi:hypothetical protein
LGKEHQIKFSSAIFVVQNVAKHGYTNMIGKYSPFKYYSSDIAILKKNEVKSKSKEKPGVSNEITANKSESLREEFNEVNNELREELNEVNNDMLVLFLFGLGDFEDFKIPCLSLQATEVLKQIRLVQPFFEDLIALQMLVNRNFSRTAVIEKSKAMMVFEYSPEL